ncbi:MAG: DUF1444 family protein [Cyanobacteria bacterium]|nr:DUF1444 family protein [Cyanobacteriota bacterium]
MFNWLKQNKTEVDEVKATKQDIVPRLKVPKFVKALRDLGVPEEQLPIMEPFLGDLLLTYSLDLPDLFQMLTLSDCERLEIPPEELKEIAIANLRAQMPEIEIANDEEQPIMQIITGKNLEACTLLLPDFWDELCQEMEGELLAVAPHRDLVFVGDSQSPDEIEALKTVAAEVLEQKDNHVLSPQLMVWRDSSWQLFENTSS